jgi:hypothetical protein
MARYERRRGVIFRPGTLGAIARPGLSIGINDGGDDAPLTPRRRLLFRLALLAIVVVGFVLIAFTVASR